MSRKKALLEFEKRSRRRRASRQWKDVDITHEATVLDVRRLRHLVDNINDDEEMDEILEVLNRIEERFDE